MLIETLQCTLQEANRLLREGSIFVTAMLGFTWCPHDLYKKVIIIKYQQIYTYHELVYTTQVNSAFPAP